MEKTAKLTSTNGQQKVVGQLRYWYGNQTNHVREECSVRQVGLNSPDLFNLHQWVDRATESYQCWMSFGQGVYKDVQLR